MFKKNELKCLFPFYLIRFIIGVTSVVLPFVIIYFQSLSFSLFQIGIFTAVFGISMFIFEIPTGAMADIYSRKFSMILGFLIAGTSILSIGLFTNFYILNIIWFFAGLGMTFISGADESWVIDNLNKKRQKHLIKEYFIKSESIQSFGMVISPLFAIFLIKFLPLNYLWFVWAGGFFLSAFVLISVPEYYIPNKKDHFSDFYKLHFLQIKKGIKFIKSKKNIPYLFFAGIFLYFMMMARDGIQPLLIDFGMPLAQLGLFYSSIALLEVFVPFLTHFFTDMKLKHSMSILISIRIVLMMGLLFIHPPFFYLAAIIFMFNQSLAGLRFPLLQTYLHSHLKSNIRATVTSVQSMANQFAIAISTPIGGLLMDKFGIPTTMVYVSFFGLIAIFFYGKIED